MARVTIDSGPLEAQLPSRDVPTDKWRELVSLRRSFLAIQINYDCRCLVQFIKEAEEMWQALGYQSADDLIRRGYELEPEEIRLAVRWLELNEPESAIGLLEAKAEAETARKRSQQAAEATTGEVLAEKQGQRNDLSNLDKSQSSRSADAGVSRAQQAKLDALARKAPEKLAEVQRGEKSTHRACIEAGIVKVPTVLELAQKAWLKMDSAQREAFLSWVNDCL